MYILEKALGEPGNVRNKTVNPALDPVVEEDGTAAYEEDGSVWTEE